MNSDGELVIAAQRHRTQKCVFLLPVFSAFVRDWAAAHDSRPCTGLRPFFHPCNSQTELRRCATKVAGECFLSQVSRPTHCASDNLCASQRCCWLHAGFSDPC